MQKFFVLLILMQISILSIAQDKRSELSYTLSADIMSRYIWRGADYGKSPSIQPTFSLKYNNFEFGVWGSFALSSNFAEIDPYVKFNVKGFSITLTDYYIPSLANDNPSFAPFQDTRFLYFKNVHAFHFDTLTNTFNNALTCNALEGMIQFKNLDITPFSILVATYFYGNDKKITDTTFHDAGKTLIKEVNVKNQYSTYIELGYAFTSKETDFDLFLGLTPVSGAYSDGFGVVNLGLTAARKIKITEDYSLPVKSSIITNPKAGNLFFIFGFSI